MKRLVIIVLTVCCMTTLASCSPYRYEEVIPVVEKMTIEQKIGQMIMPAVPGSKAGRTSRKILKNFQPGGIILFGFNLENRQQTIEFIDTMQAESMKHSGIPLFISIDQEGGRVKRIRDGVTQFPGNLAFGVADDKDLVYGAARVIGLELRMMGVNMNLAPVLDVNNNPLNPVINLRSFGSEPEIVSRMGVSYIKGLQDGKCIAVGKHFPGHGDTDRDSHHTLPVIRYDMKRLQKVELVPFRHAIDAGVEGIMTAHIAYPEILDSIEPATISSFFLTTLLREKMGFKGIVLTDDMEMEGIAGVTSPGEGAVKAVQAGADIILISSYGENVKHIYETLLAAVKEGAIPEERIDKSVTRILEQKVRYGILKKDKQSLKMKEFVLTDDDRDILSQANKINRLASQKALYFCAGKNDPFSNYQVRGSGQNCVLITSDSTAVAAFKRRFKDITVLKKWDAKKTAGKRVYVVTGSSSGKEIAEMVSQEHLDNKKVLVIYTGNPFRLYDRTVIPPTVFTFSNTDCSIQQAVGSIAGDFTPADNINVDLGFKSQ